MGAGFIKGSNCGSFSKLTSPEKGVMPWSDYIHEMQFDSYLFYRGKGLSGWGVQPRKGTIKHRADQKTRRSHGSRRES